MVSSLGEDGGRAGDEVVLPLGKQGRLEQLVNMPQVRDRVADALGLDEAAGEVGPELIGGL